MALVSDGKNGCLGCKPKKHRRASLLLLLAIFFGQVPVGAATELHFYLEDEPIYTSRSPDQPGFLNEIVAALIDDLSIAAKAHYLPWKRAQMMAQKDPLGVIFPLARTASREPVYLWVCKIFDVPVMFISLEGDKVLNSYAEAALHRGIGVVRGTPQEEKLLEQNVPHVALTGEELYQALHRRDVTAIFTASSEALYGWKTAGFEEKLQFGKILMTLPLWIAANKNSTHIEPLRWRKSLERLKGNGKYQKIFSHYFANK